MPQMPIVTVTLNPALDVAVAVDQVVPGPKLRTGAPLTEPGGGGINVARAVRLLGGQAQALAPLGGSTGARLAELLLAEGVELRSLPGSGETRQSLTATDAEGLQYRFVLPGPEPAPAAELIAAIVAAVPSRALVVLSGSQPPGLAADFPLALAAALPEGARLIVDTSGPALDLLARGQHTALDTLRMNRVEAEAAAGRPLPTLAEFRDFCAGLVGQGAARVVIAAWGREGNVLSDGRHAWHCIPPEDVPVVSRVGAGDSFTAGYTLALARGSDLPEALRQGTAAASAAVMTPGTQLCRRADVAHIAPRCRIVELQARGRSHDHQG